jgi:hypothetical protein
MVLSQVRGFWQVKRDCTGLSVGDAIGNQKSCFIPVTLPVIQKGSL